MAAPVLLFTQSTKYEPVFVDAGSVSFPPRPPWHEQIQRKLVEK